MNKVTLIGRVGKDPDVKYFDSGKVLAEFSLATSEKFKKKNGEVQESTEWHNVKVWGKGAEVIEKHVKKGSPFCVVGKITTESWEADGQTKYKTVIECREFEFLPGERRSYSSASSDGQNQQAATGQVEEDGLPF